MKNLLKSTLMYRLLRTAKDKTSFRIRRLNKKRKKSVEFYKLFHKSNGKASYLGSFKYFSQWRKSLMPGRGPLADHRPWIVYDSFKLLEQIVKPEMTIFEYGTGGSSAYFSNNVKHVFSVEHDKQWLEKTALAISSIGNHNWTGVCITAEDDPLYDSKNVLTPTDYISSVDSFKGMNFFNYASYIDRFDNESFDIVLIDGRARTSCFTHAKTKVKISGYLILDNSERERYNIIHEQLENERWMKFNFFGPGPYADYEFWQTTIWKRTK